MITPNNKVCYDSNLGAIYAAKCLSGNITNLYWPETFHLGQLRYTDDDAGCLLVLLLYTKLQVNKK